MQLRNAFLSSLVALVLAACQDSPARLDAGSPAASAHAADRFERHCAVCHGTQGAGDGPAAHLLFPPARDFTRGRFKLVSTENGVPTQRDLVDTLRRGMPGSGMLSFAWMEGRELEDLALHVRHLAVEGLALGLEMQALDAGLERTESEARALALRRMTPGRPIEPPAYLPEDRPALERGRRLYLAHCAECHGDDGRGTRDPVWTEDGELDWARDFGSGVLLGGSSPAALARRIAAGMPGTSMPALRLPPADEAALIAYIRTLLPPDAEEKLVQRPLELRVRRLDTDVPTIPDDPRWERAEEVELALAPLFWTRAPVLHVSVSALHDGENFAIRLSWRDDTRDDGASMESTFSDGVALQFSAEPDPPLFAMGSEEHPVNIWHWKSFRLVDVAGLTDLLESRPHDTLPGGLGRVGVLDAPLYRPAPAATSEADSVLAEGLLSAPGFDAQRLSTRAFPYWNEGHWQVVFARSLEARAEGETELTPGAAVHVSCAVWNGSTGDHGGQKSIGIWHTLQLDP